MLCGFRKRRYPAPTRRACLQSFQVPRKHLGISYTELWRNCRILSEDLILLRFSQRLSDYMSQYLDSCKESSLSLFPHTPPPAPDPSQTLHSCFATLLVFCTKGSNSKILPISVLCFLCQSKQNLFCMIHSSLETKWMHHHQVLLFRLGYTILAGNLRKGIDIQNVLVLLLTLQQLLSSRSTTLELFT